MHGKVSKRNGSVVALLAWSAAGLCAAGEEIAYDRLVSKQGPALVTVKFVLKMSLGQMGEQESETEIMGVMVEASGLVLCSNTQLGGIPPAMKRMIARFGGDFSATPTDIKVLAGDDQEGVEGELMARDSELDLAWVRIKKAQREYPYIDFGKPGVPRLGDRLLTVQRVGKHFDRVTVVDEGRVGGLTHKPRDLFVGSGGIGGAFGVPVFNAGGEVVGLTILQLPEDESDGSPMAMLSRARQFQESSTAWILPAADVVKATQRAKEAGSGDDGK